MIWRRKLHENFSITLLNKYFNYFLKFYFDNYFFFLSETSFIYLLLYIINILSMLFVKITRELVLKNNSKICKRLKQIDIF